MVGGVQVSKDMTKEVGQGAVCVFVCLGTVTGGQVRKERNSWSAGTGAYLTCERPE